MKKLTVVFMLIIFAILACTGNKVVMKAKIGDVTFNHKFHSTTMECAICHGDGTPGKITMDKDKAHTLCRDCHIKQGGPTKCYDCH